MWRLKQLMPKEQAGLEGKTVEVGSLRLQIRSVIAEGGFSCVYLAREAQSGKQFAVKHIVCNDGESLDLVKKEVNALKALCGHPNIITLHAQAMYNMGRTQECFVVTDYCEKMMVEVLDSRGAGYFDEKQLLLIFRDVCNAVYAMHCLSPPMAHRDLKAENLLLGSDGLWKLCDFGSISTNHKRFEKAAEMGIEEDTIRKHTTPAYRAPEMWDLYRRELISEKVDIWALGCLLFRMAYLKSAFDGDSKLQVLNGNYRIPEQPKYSHTVTGLIKEMLNSSPEARPTALQVWQRVNMGLPVECQKAAPDKPPSSSMSQEKSAHTRSHSIMPSRAPPPPPQRSTEQEVSSLADKDTERKSSPFAPREKDVASVSGSVKGGGLGSFWSTQYAQEALHEESESSPSSKNSNDPTRHHGSVSTSPQPRTQEAQPRAQEAHSSPSTGPRSMRSNFGKSRGPLGRGYMRPEEVASDENGNGNVNKRTTTAEPPQIASGPERSNQSSQDAFNEFVADFQKASIYSADNASHAREEGQQELDRLRNELKEAKREKEEMVLKYEKLAAMCRSQRLEIQELKQSLQALNSHSSPSKGFGVQGDSMIPSPPLKPEVGPIWDSPQQAMRSSGASVEPRGWKAFDDETSKQVSGPTTDYSPDPARTNLFDSARFESARPEALKMGPSAESTQKSRTSGDGWGLHDGFATLSPGFTAVKGTGQGAIGNPTAFSRNSSKGGTRMASIYSNESATKGSGVRMASTHNNQPSGWSNF